MKYVCSFHIKTVIFVSILLLISADSWAVRPYTPVHADPVEEPWRWRTFTIPNAVSIQQMVEDTQGNIWFACSSGVVRYDGFNWETFKLDYGTPLTLCATQDGNVYVGSQWEIRRFRNGAWDQIFETRGDLPWFFKGMKEDFQGGIWAATLWGALYIMDDKATLYTTEDFKEKLQKRVLDLDFKIIPKEIFPQVSLPEGAFDVLLSRGYVFAMEKGGYAERAGLVIGDHIMEVDGREMPTTTFYSRQIPENVTIKRGLNAPSQKVTIPSDPKKGSPILQPAFLYDIYVGKDGKVWFGLRSGEIIEYNHLQGDHQWHIHTQTSGDTTPHISQTPDGKLRVISGGQKVGLNTYDGQRWSSVSFGETGAANLSTSILVTRDGILWVGGTGELRVHRDGVWTVYRPPTLPLPRDRIAALLETSDGTIWLAVNDMVAKLEYATSRWIRYEGLNFQCETPDGVQWFLSVANEVVRYDGKTWIRYDSTEGPMTYPSALMVRKNGTLWATGTHRGTATTARFDGLTWSRQQHPKLSWGIHPKVHLEASDSSLWFGAATNVIKGSGQLSGLIRFKDNAWSHYSFPLAQIWPYAIGETSDGNVWVGGFRGLQFFNGQQFQSIANLPDLRFPIHHIAPDNDGGILVGTRKLGVYHYTPSSGPFVDRESWSKFTKADGLADNVIGSTLKTPRGNLWVATRGRGISVYDGQSWITQVLPPTLLHFIQDLHIPKLFLRSSLDGAVWINIYSEKWTDRGKPTYEIPKDPKMYSFYTIRYEPDIEPPETKVTTFLEEVSQPGNTVIAWQGIDAWGVTPNEELEYSWRLDGGNWSPFTKNTSKIFLALPDGDHHFEVKTRDQDFNKDSSPALATFSVTPPVWKQHWFIVMVLIFSASVGIQSYRVFSAKQKLLDEAETELQTAHNLQMKLMPQKSPHVEGFEFAGRCISANHVGGDFFQYFDANSKVALVLADVTGHAMDAAIPVVMFSGVLDRQMELNESLLDTFRHLNHSLHRTLDTRTFICFAMGEIDLSNRILRLSNGGCPYPYHFQAKTGEITELQVDAYPLGVRPDTEYEVLEKQLQSGDLVIFCSDGIIEAENVDGDVFGYERTAETIRKACEDDHSAEMTIDHLLAKVTVFRGDAPQEDDMTCVVVRVL